MSNLTFNRRQILKFLGAGAALFVLEPPRARALLSRRGGRPALPLAGARPRQRRVSMGQPRVRQLPDLEYRAGDPGRAQRPADHRSRRPGLQPAARGQARE